MKIEKINYTFTLLILTVILVLSVINVTSQDINDEDFWNKAEQEIKESKIKEKEIENMRTDSTVPDLTIRKSKEYVEDKTKIWEVYVDDKNVDSLQIIIDKHKNDLYSDRIYFKMKDFNINDKIAYIKYLLKNNLKDTSQVYSFCDKYHYILKLECDFLTYILNSQTSDSRFVINLNIKIKQEHMSKIGDLMYSL